MIWVDYLIFGIYFLAMLGIGFFYYRSNKDAEDYYVGGRNQGSWHIGLSVVASDVGGGFSIGLGGLGFVMGIAGSWMLLTGLIGAWLSALFLIPRVSAFSRQFKPLTFPQLFDFFYNRRVALVAGVISAIGYTGFTSSQLLAGAKLASATFEDLSLTYALIIMGVIAVVYTVAGGLKAVIYTDTIQWIILLSGLIFIGIPLGFYAVGGYQGIREALPPSFLSLGNISWVQLVNWGITIIPIWFVGMTLYQRIYACKDEKTARKAWYIAGFFEYPIMAFMGVLLGLFARVGAQQGLFEIWGYADANALDAEMGLPLLLKTVLPVGLTGLMLSAYFSAIMSTADSCLMAASGNIVSDILERFFPVKRFSDKKHLQFSQLATLLVGILALVLALGMTNVLELMLLSYAFMVSGLFIPVLGILFLERPNAKAALWSMLVGGGTTLGLIILNPDLPLGLDANIFGIAASGLIFLVLQKLLPPSSDPMDFGEKKTKSYSYAS
jgi:SSS family solute:Na+ symporter